MYPTYPPYGRKKVCKEQDIAFPPQQQPVQPGMEYPMEPKPIFDNPNYKAADKLKGRTAIITGGDSGIGRAVAVAYAKEGANLVLCYLNERRDAEETKRYVENLGAKCILIAADLVNPDSSVQIVERTIEHFGNINILVNNCGVQFFQDSILDISNKQLHDTFAINVYSYFYLCKAALPYMHDGDSIINTSSIVAYQGEKNMIDYTATNGARVSFTRALALNLAEKGIRVNSIAPGFFWTPLQPASQPLEQLVTFGADTPMKRAGQPFEIAPAYVYLASDDSKYVTGLTLHVNGGEMVVT